MNLVRNRVKPIWVVDSRADQSFFPLPVGAKSSQCLQQRDKMVQRVESLFVRALDMLKSMGVPALRAVESADAVCALICNERVADFMVCDSLDGFAFGPEKLLVGLNKKHARGVVQMELPKVLESIGLSQEQLRDLCIVFAFVQGCSAKEGAGLTPTKVYKLIKETSSMDKAVEELAATAPGIKALNYKAEKDRLLHLFSEEQKALSYKDV